LLLVGRFALVGRLLLVGRLALDDARALRVGALLGELLVRAGELPLLRVLRRALLVRAGELPLLRLVRRAPLARAGALPLLRDAPAERARGRVFVWANGPTSLN